MDESLMQRRRVGDEGLRVVNSFRPRKRQGFGLVDGSG